MEPTSASTDSADSSQRPRNTPGGFPFNPLWGLGLLILFALVLLVRQYLSIDYLADREIQLRDQLQANPLLVGLVGTGIYIAMAGFSIPGAAVLTIIYGWYFGFWGGLLVVSFGSTAGATSAFLVTRYLLRDWVQQKFRSRWTVINEAFDREGAFYLFSLRLIPAIPFFMINLVMGLTRIRTRTFWWVSQLGMLPGTAAYVYFGSTIPSLKVVAQQGVGQVFSWQLLVAFAIVGLLPLILKRMMSYWKTGQNH